MDEAKVYEFNIQLHPDWDAYRHKFVYFQHVSTFKWFDQITIKSSLI